MRLDWDTMLDCDMRLDWDKVLDQETKKHDKELGGECGAKLSGLG